MKRHRSSFMLLTLSLTAAAALGVLPGSALAGSLLSGYGGPGGGTQALLGSTLVNGSGPSGGSGGGAGGGSSSGAGAAAGGAGSLGGSANALGGSHGSGNGDSGSSASGRGGTGGAAQSGSGASKHANGANGTSAGGSATYTSTEGPRPVAGAAAARDAQAAPLGFTRTDALLLVLVLGVLSITMLLTRGFARTQQHF